MWLYQQRSFCQALLHAWHMLPDPFFDHIGDLFVMGELLSVSRREDTRR
jgi:hypothetical protein